MDYTSIDIETERHLFKMRNRSWSDEDSDTSSDSSASDDEEVKKMKVEASNLKHSADEIFTSEGAKASVDKEQLELAFQYLSKAAKLYESCNKYAAMDAYTDLACHLSEYERRSEALRYLRRALQYAPRKVEIRVSILEKIVTCQLDMYNWSGALNSCMKILKIGNYPEHPHYTEDDEASWHKAESLRVCLSLITVPRHKLAIITRPGGCLESYAMGRKPVDHMFPELYWNLQSLVHAYQSQDVNRIIMATTALRQGSTEDELIVFDHLNNCLNVETKNNSSKKQKRPSSSENSASTSQTLAAQNGSDLDKGVSEKKAEAAALMTSAKNVLRPASSSNPIDGEKMEFAFHSLLKAATLYERCDKFWAMRAYTDLASYLMKYERWSEALRRLETALKYAGQDAESRVSILETIVTCQVHMRLVALNSCMKTLEIWKYPDHPRYTEQDESRWHKVESLRVFLQLSTLPPYKLATCTGPGGCLESYAMGREQMDHISPEVFSQLQSLVHAYQSENRNQIKSATAALQPFFSQDYLIALDLLRR